MALGRESDLALVYHASPPFRSTVCAGLTNDPAHGRRGRVESVAGREPATGMLTTDVLPEFAAEELQQGWVDR